MSGVCRCRHAWRACVPCVLGVRTCTLCNMRGCKAACMLTGHVAVGCKRACMRAHKACVR
eukprot:366011-Chlamydomonas_euryale.AAC.2